MQSFIMGNDIYSLENKIIDVNNADFNFHTFYRSRMTMTRSKTWVILDKKNRTNAWLDNIIGNNSAVSE